MCAQLVAAFERCVGIGKPSIIHVKVETNAITPMTTLDAIRAKSLASVKGV